MVYGSLNRFIPRFFLFRVMDNRRITLEQRVVASMLQAYRRGYFPMAECRPPWDPYRSGPSTIHWFSPDPRGILPLLDADGFHVSRRLSARMRTRPFTITINTEFTAVMHGCAAQRMRTDEAPDNDESWIDDTLIEWYTLLHRAGHAHSVEAWATNPYTGERALVGGVYGVSIGAAFFGESMFCRPRERQPDGTRDPLDGTDASKICLVMLVRALATAGYSLFDTQMVTSHVGRFGGRQIPRTRYLELLDRAIDEENRWPQARRILEARAGNQS